MSKKQVTELIIDNTDGNTAPVKKIVEELQVKNKRAIAFYSNNIKQRQSSKRVQNYHCAVPGHPLHTFKDDWDGEINFDYFEPFPYRSMPPKMLTLINNMGMKDPVVEIMKSKMEWRNTLGSLKMSASLRNVKEKYESFNEDVVRCPKLVVDIAAHVDRDPDPFFDSSYNWYYAGNGNLQYVCLNWVDYILHSSLNCVYLSEFNITDMIIKSKYSAVFKSDENNIFEIIYSPLNIVALRTNNKIYILKIAESNDEITFEKIIVTESEIPYTSISFDKYHKNILYVTTLDNKLSIVNIDRIKARSVKLKASKADLLDNWNSVIGSGRESYIHVTKHSIFQYDKRSNKKINMWNNLENMIDEVDCNDISVARHIEGSSSLYFGTDHHLFLMDLRFHQTSKPNVVQRWSHGMASPPTYLSHCHMEFNKNLICLSSQWCEDMCVVPNYYENFKEPSGGGVSIPYRPPSILSALNEAQQNMLCFDLYSPIESRLCTAITGNLAIEQGNKFDILMINALGDISCHTLYPEHMDTFIENDTAGHLSDWCANYKLEKKVFEVSSIENIANALSQLKKVPSDYKVDGGWVKTSTKYNEQEVVDAFENEEIDTVLKYAWYKEANETQAADQSSLALNLYFSEEENDMK